MAGRGLAGAPRPSRKIFRADDSAADDNGTRGGVRATSQPLSWGDLASLPSQWLRDEQADRRVLPNFGKCPSRSSLAALKFQEPVRDAGSHPRILCTVLE